MHRSHRNNWTTMCKTSARLSRVHMQPKMGPIDRNRSKVHQKCIWWSRSRCWNCFKWSGCIYWIYIYTGSGVVCKIGELQKDFCFSWKLLPRWQLSKRLSTLLSIENSSPQEITIRLTVFKCLENSWEVSRCGVCKVIMSIMCRRIKIFLWPKVRANEIEVVAKCPLFWTVFGNSPNWCICFRSQLPKHVRSVNLKDRDISLPSLPPRHA